MDIYCSYVHIVHIVIVGMNIVSQNETTVKEGS